MTATLLPAPNAPQGTVSFLPSYSASTFPVGSGILCRNTAPLVAFAYGLLQRDVPCRILGKDIGKQLGDIVVKMRAANLEDFKTRLAKWRDREVSRHLEDHHEASAARVQDQFDCLMFFTEALDEDSRTVSSLLAKIDLLFTDDASTALRVTLSTIHKSKGLEYPQVFLLDRHLIPSKYATQPWQLTQERNLLYVAVTRAKLDLFYINSENWKD